MPNQGFYALVLPQGELSRKQWQELLSRRELTLGHWLERYTFQRLGDATFCRPEGRHFKLDQGNGYQPVEIQGAPGYNFKTQGIFRPLQKLGLGNFRSLSPGDQVRQPYYVVGFTRSRIWIVLEIRIPSEQDPQPTSLVAHEMTADGLVEEFSIDYYRLWAFLGQALEEFGQRKLKESEALQTDVREAQEERDFVWNLYQRVPLPW